MLIKLWNFIKELLFGKSEVDPEMQRILDMIEKKRAAAEKRLKEIEEEKKEIEDEKTLDENIDYFNSDDSE